MLCGIDEAGRGALAGDLVVAACVLHANIQGLDDSKKLSSKKREQLYEIIIKNSDFLILHFSSSKIDNLGLSACMNEALTNIKDVFIGYEIIFDGNTSFNVSGIKTLIKADQSVKQVSAASILAKVTRDKMMLKLANLYPQYQFDKHKGYGTALHVKMIKQFGLSKIHRKSFKLKQLSSLF